MAALLMEASAVANELRKPLPVVASRSGRSAGDRSILQILDRHGPQSVPQVARIRGTSRQNIQILVNRLEGQGSVEFRANAAHKRSNLVGLTDQGRVELGATARQEGELLESISSQLSGTEMRVAARLLGRLRGLLATGSAGERPAWKRARRAERGPSTQKAAEVTTAPEPERPRLTKAALTKVRFRSICSKSWSCSKTTDALSAASRKQMILTTDGHRWTRIFEQNAPETTTEGFSRERFAQAARTLMD
ncbi:MAG: hypothetical protein DME25_07550 [Verrucomicrobia bacterium]|nr:MAG: hypothetical protein DME25_07550 [Verrucomicrobiota bacterium]